MGLPGWEDAATCLVKPSVILLPCVRNLFSAHVEKGSLKGDTPLVWDVSRRRALRFGQVSLCKSGGLLFCSLNMPFVPAGSHCKGPGHR